MAPHWRCSLAPSLPCARLPAARGARRRRPPPSSPRAASASARPRPSRRDPADATPVQLGGKRMVQSFFDGCEVPPPSPHTVLHAPPTPSPLGRRGSRRLRGLQVRNRSQGRAHSCADIAPAAAAGLRASISAAASTFGDGSHRLGCSHGSDPCAPPARVSEPQARHQTHPPEKCFGTQDRCSGPMEQRAQARDGRAPGLSGRAHPALGGACPARPIRGVRRRRCDARHAPRHLQLRRPLLELLRGRIATSTHAQERRVRAP